jgi:hypothetical protein
MERKYILNRYAHYYEYLQILGKIPLTMTVVIEHLNPNRGLLQSCYKEIKEQNFNGNLIDYLCWISAQYLLDMAQKSIPDGRYIEYLKNNYASIKEDANNLLRLANKRPELFIEWGDTRNLLMMWHDNYMNEIKSRS